MTVAELIAALQKLPQDLPVIRTDGDGDNLLVARLHVEQASWLVWEGTRNAFKSGEGEAVRI